MAKRRRKSSVEPHTRKVRRRSKRARATKGVSFKYIKVKRHKR